MTNAAQALANRLIVGPTSGRVDLLTELDDSGYVSFEEVDGVEFDPTRIDARTSRILVVGGNDADVIVRTQRAAARHRPRAGGQAGGGRRRVAGRPSRVPARGEELDGIRGSDLGEQIATADNFDTVDGPLLAVLVLGDLGQGIVGHYGFGSGADRAVPEWWGV